MPDPEQLSHEDATAEDHTCALADASEAEDARRALDRAGLLRSRAFKAPGGLIALPLTEAGAATLTDERTAASLGVRLVELRRLPVAGRGCGDTHSRMHQRALQALQEAGLPPAQARAVLPASALPRRWEKLGDVVLFAPQGCFAPASAVASLAAAPKRALMASLAASLGACRLGVQGRIAQEESELLQREPAHVLQRKSGARLIWPDGADGWTEHRVRRDRSASQPLAPLHAAAPPTTPTLPRRPPLRPCPPQENGIVYGLDVRRSMFSSGNGTEKRRVASRR